jgi:hypothetical protein
LVIGWLQKDSDHGRRKLTVSLKCNRPRTSNKYDHSSALSHSTEICFLGDHTILHHWPT